jgi:hypothetical protein
MDVTAYAEIEPFTTKDGSEIREWAGPVSAPARNQSLAEATIPPGGATLRPATARSSRPAPGTSCSTRATSRYGSSARARRRTATRTRS